MWARGGGSRLWDRDGLEWTDSGEELDQAESERLLADLAVPAVMSMGAGPLRWLDGSERLHVWRTDIAPNFHDVSGWKPPPGAPGQKPFHVTMWKRDGGAVLLLITDFD